MRRFHRPRHPPVANMRNLVLVIAIFATLYLAKSVFIPLAFAVTLALILAPAVDWLIKIHASRVLASLIAVVITTVAMGLIGFVIFDQVIQVLGELPSYQDNIHRKIQAMRAPSSSVLGRASESVK